MREYPEHYDNKVRLGEHYKCNLTGELWQVVDIYNGNVTLIPDVDTERQYKEKDLGDYMERL